MAGNDDARLAAAEAAAVLQQRVTDKVADKMATLQVAEARTLVRAIALLLKEEQSSATALEVETTAAALQLASTTASSSSAPPPPPSGGDAAIVAMLHV
jgi:hypothetical protein